MRSWRGLERLWLIELKNQVDCFTLFAMTAELMQQKIYCFAVFAMALVMMLTMTLLMYSAFP